MAEMILLKCPQCGANLSIEKGRTEAYCTYCGAKLFIDTNHEYTIHNVNEADITRAETDRMIRMEQLRMQKEEKEIKRARNKKAVKYSLIYGILLMVAGVLLAFVDAGFVCLLLFGIVLLCLAAGWGIELIEK